MYSPAQEVPGTPTIKCGVRVYNPSQDAIVPDEFIDPSQEATHSVPGTPVVSRHLSSPWAPASRLTPTRRHSYRPTPLVQGSPYVSSPKEQVVPTTPMSAIVHRNSFGTPTSRPRKSTRQHRTQLPRTPLPVSSLTHDREDKLREVHVVDATGDHVTDIPASNNCKSCPSQREAVVRFRRSPESRNISHNVKSSSDFLDSI